MAEAISEALEDDRYIINPGMVKEFVYAGGLIPFQVDITNLDGEHDVRYYASAQPAESPHGWTLYGDIPPGKTVSLLLDWSDQVGLFGDLGPVGSIKISGDYIFPYDGPDNSASQETDI